MNPASIKKLLPSNLRESLSASIHSELPEDKKKEMCEEMFASYSNPDELEKMCQMTCTIVLLGITYHTRFVRKLQLS